MHKWGTHFATIAERLIQNIAGRVSGSEGVQGRGGVGKGADMGKFIRGTTRTCRDWDGKEGERERWR